MSDVGSDRCQNTRGFLTNNVKEIFWDLNFLSEDTGCRKTQVLECTCSTVYTIQNNIQEIQKTQDQYDFFAISKKGQAMDLMVMRGSLHYTYT